MKPSHRADQIQEYFFSKKLREIAALNADGKDIINLGIGSPDLEPDDSVKDEMIRSIQEPYSFKYQPYRGINELNSSLKSWYKATYSVELGLDYLPVLGSKEGLHFLMLAYLNDGDEALIPNPGYPAYSSAIKLAGGVPVSYELETKDNWQINLETIQAKVTSKTKLLVVNYPHMPTGTAADRAALQRLVNFCQEHHILLINDNPYSLILSENPFSILQLEGAENVCIELNSLSKSASMAGARIGFVIGEKHLVEPVAKVQSSFSSGMFKPVQLGAIAALNVGAKFSEETNKIYSERRQEVYRLLDLLKCEYSTAGEGLFVWAKVPNGYKNGLALADKLLDEARVFITPGFIFGTQGENYIRVSLCQPKELIKSSINRIEKIHL